MNKIVKTRAHLMAARLQIPKHDNLTAKFLKREGNCRADPGVHWKDKRVSFKAKHRLLQSTSFQFPCAAMFKKWGWQEEDLPGQLVKVVPWGLWLWLSLKPFLLGEA